MKRELAEALVIRRKQFIVTYALATRNIRKACQECGVPRSSFYRWKNLYEKQGVEGLIRKKPIARSHPRQIPPEYVEKILHLRMKYHLGPQRIAWYLERYHDFKTSCSSVYRTLKRHGIGPLPRKVGRKAIHTRRYTKRVPGHQIQIDVKFLTLTGDDGQKIRRYQFTVIDDATRVRALRIYQRHNQESAIDFINYVVESFPSASTQFAPIADMSGRPDSTGTSRTWGSGMSTSSRGHLN